MYSGLAPRDPPKCLRWSPKTADFDNFDLPEATWRPPGSGTLSSLRDSDCTESIESFLMKSTGLVAFVLPLHGQNKGSMLPFLSQKQAWAKQPVFRPESSMG